MKKTALLSGVVSFALLAACGGGGGGGGSPTSNNNSSNNSGAQPPQGTYIGAAAQGDYAKFTVLNNTINYEFTGHWANQWCGGTCSGSADLEAYTNGNFFWKVKQNGQHVADMLLANNLGIAVVDANNNNKATIIGLQHSQDPTAQDVVGNYIYLELLINGSINLTKLTINNDNTFTYQDLNGGDSGSGCWTIDTTKKVIVAALSDTIVNNTNNVNFDCANYDGSQGIDVRAYIKPGTRKAIVVDYVNSSMLGFGIGLEEKAITFDTAKTYEYEFYGYDTVYDTGEFGTGKVEYKNGQWQYVWTQGNYTGCGVLTLNKDCNGQAVNGLLCAEAGNYDSSTGTCTGAGSPKYNVFIDPDDKYYFAITQNNNNPYIEVGAFK